MGEVTGLMIRSLAEDNATVGTGFNINPGAPDSMDQNQSDSPVSERFIDENYVNHKVRVIGTLDGETAFQWQEPSLVGFTKSVRHYSCSVIGVWHMMEMRAEAVGESFHPVAFETTAISAGRFN